MPEAAGSVGWPGDAPGGVEVIGHRGYAAVAPENTLVSLRRAVEAGADAVEFDLHFTADGIPVVIHDETLERTTDGAGAVRDSTLADLRRLDAGSWFDPAFAGEPVPSVEEALRSLEGGVERVYPEIKGWRTPEDLRGLVDLLRRTGWEERAVVISLEWESLEVVRSASEAVEVGFIVDDENRLTGAVERAVEDGRALVDVAHTLILDDPELGSDLRARGVESAVWTVNDEAEARRIVGAGIRRLTTDRVARLVSLVGREGWGRPTR